MRGKPRRRVRDRIGQVVTSACDCRSAAHSTGEVFCRCSDGVAQFDKSLPSQVCQQVVHEETEHVQELAYQSTVGTHQLIRVHRIAQIRLGVLTIR